MGSAMSPRSALRNNLSTVRVTKEVSAHSVDRHHRLAVILRHQQKQSRRGMHLIVRHRYCPSRTRLGFQVPQSVAAERLCLKKLEWS
jgi:hypothetical protein